MNVALSRAKSLLIAVGNPFILEKDPCWRQFLKYCIKNGAYKGCKFSLCCIDGSKEVDIDASELKAERALLGMGAGSDVMDGVNVYWQDKPWRCEH